MNNQTYDYVFHCYGPSHSYPRWKLKNPPRKRMSPKERKARSLFAKAKADFFSAISDINNEYGTNFNAENLTPET